MSQPFVHTDSVSSPSSSATTKARPALKLVKTNTLKRDDWLEVRKGGIGSSDAAAAVGLHPYKSQLQLWMEKTGRDAGLPVVDPNDDQSPMYWGTLLEPIVAAHYTRRTTPGARATGCGASMRCCSILNIPGCWRTSTARSWELRMSRSWSARQLGSTGPGCGATVCRSMSNCRSCTNWP